MIASFQILSRCGLLLIGLSCSFSHGNVIWAADGDWPRWRGINNDGMSAEKGLLKQWPEGGPPIAWKSKGLGGGFSSLAVVGDRMFTMGVMDGGSHLLCVSRKDGSILWNAKFGGGEPNCTPTVDGNRVYAVSRDGELACVNVADGKIVWQKSFKKEFGGSEPGWGYSESPLIDGDVLVCTPGSMEAHMVGLNKTTGAVLWKAALDSKLQLKGHGGAGYSSPVISNGGGLKQYVTLTGKGVVSVDAKSGKIVWIYDKISNGTANIPTPIVFKDYILCSSGYGDGGTALIKLVKRGKTVGWDEVYYFAANEMQNHHGGMILLDGFVYMGHGHNNGFPLCFNLMTGKDAWRPGRGPGRESAAVAYADGHLYFRYQDGTMALIQATPSEYRVKGQFELATHNRESWPHPVIAGGMMYIRDQDDLTVYDLRAK
jgi:outer membrane protein assembly factor BamB